MGTRSITRIWNENNEPLVTMYRQFDGYIEGHGLDLAKLCSVAILDGFGGQKYGEYANGAGCLAAQIVSEIKNKQLGNVYIVPHDARSEEFNYKVQVQGVGKPVLITVTNDEGIKLFGGTAAELLAFIERGCEHEPVPFIVRSRRRTRIG